MNMFKGRDVPDPISFWKKYSLLNSSEFMAVQQERPKEFCRFCNKDASHTPLTEITHLLPELLGQNKIYTYEECDVCNHVFSGYESHLSNFVRPFITMLGITGKRGVPTFQSRSVGGDQDLVTSLVHDSFERKKLYAGYESDLSIDEEKQTMSILFRHPPFIPLKIYKALVKIGMSLLPAQMDVHCQHIYRWLLSADDNIDFINYGFMTTITGAYWKAPSADLYQANYLNTKDEELPEYSLVLRFANQVFQVFLPFTDRLLEVHNGRRTLVIELLPAGAYDVFREQQQTYGIKPFEFGRNFKVMQNRKLEFSFGSLEPYVR